MRQGSDSVRQQLHYLLTLARRKPGKFLLAAGHRLLRPLRRRIRAYRAAERAGRAFETYYRRDAATSAAWRQALARILPAACLERETYLRLWSHTRVEVLAQAEKICQHRFNLLGSGEVELGAEIDWGRDFKSGRRWPLEASHRLQLIYADDSSDIKVPWELSRFQHLPLLGKAYWLAGDEKFAREFARQVEDWRAKNPLGYGPHWMVAMEAAIRGLNWLYAANFFVGSTALPANFWYELRKALFAHGWFIRRNLEWNPYACGNHYLADLVGLLYLGAFFYDSRAGREWWDFARRELRGEIEHQVSPDGVAQEASLAYHRLVTELLLAGCATAVRSAGWGEVSAASLEGLFGRAVVGKLEAMLEFILHYTRPDGRAPVVGDTDDGRLTQLAGYGIADPGEHRHLLCTGALLFAREDFAQAAEGVEWGWEEAWWHLGATRPQRASSEPGSVASRAFPAGGFFVLRSPRAYVLLRCGDVGLGGLGAHAHCDQLSFELAVDGRPLVIDPGSYVYTADLEERYRFRSTASHNTVQVEGAEQNWMSVRGCFQMPDDTRARVRHWRSDDAEDEFEGEHFGYDRLPARVGHRRAVVLDKREAALYVVDHLAGRRQVWLEWFFHLAPGVSVAALSHTLRPALRKLREFEPPQSQLDCSYGLRASGGSEVPLLVFSPLRLAAAVEEGWVSARYGVRVKAPVLAFRAQTKLPVAVLFVFDLGRG